jgi:hypothetical protein
MDKDTAEFNVAKELGRQIVELCEQYPLSVVCEALTMALAFAIVSTLDDTGDIQEATRIAHEQLDAAVSGFRELKREV